MNKLDLAFDEHLQTKFELKLDELLAGSKDVTPRQRHQLAGLLRYYAKKAHPFRACVRDNRKRFGSRAEAVCATLKDIIRGTTRWRGHPELDHGAAGLAASEPPIIDDDVLSLIDRLSEMDLHTLLDIAELDEERRG